MDFERLAETLVAVGFIAAGAFLAPMAWHPERGRLSRPPTWWFGGRGFLRTLPLSIGYVWFLSAVLLLGPFVPEQPRDGFGFIRPAWFSLPLSVVGLLGLPTWISIYLFNRPRFLVPPSMRGDRGVLAGDDDSKADG